MIYRFDPNRTLENNNGVPETHAIHMVYFAVDTKVPCLKCQNSRGRCFGSNEFQMVDIASIKELCKGAL